METGHRGQALAGMKTAVVCPLYNDIRALDELAARLAEAFDLVVLVDDGSRAPVADPKRPGVILLRHDRNLGKGAALVTGFRAALAAGADVVGTIDSDGEHDPACFEDALALADPASLVILSRAVHYGMYGARRRRRNVAISGLVSRLLGQRIADTQSGMRVYGAETLAAILARPLPAGYAMETAALFAVAEAGLTLAEVPMRRMGLPEDRKKADNPGVLAADAAFFLRIAALSLGRAVSARLAARRAAFRPVRPGPSR